MAIVRNLQNNFYYRFLGGNKFRNLCTGVVGEVSDEKAREIFKINLEATYLCENFPLVEQLISSLKLKCDVGSMQVQE